MGKRGPAPKPTNLRVLHGEKPYRINHSEPTIDIADPNLPLQWPEVTLDWPERAATGSPIV
jgi:hypothetical protein